MSMAGKLILRIFLGIVITIFSLFLYLLLLFLPFGNVMYILLFISYISLIVFLIRWNGGRAKQKCFLLLIPVFCIVVGLTVIIHYAYVESIPTVDESIRLHLYMPFSDSPYLARLDTEPTLRLFDNLPVLDGATALFPVYAAFVNAVYPEDDHLRNRTLLHSTTAVAYNNLLDGRVDIIFCAGPSNEQTRLFSEKGIELNFVPIGKEAFVFFVNIGNPIYNLSVEEIQGIYSGRIRNWKKLRGRNRSIRAFQRPDNSGSQTVLENIMGDNEIIRARRENIPAWMGGMINQVARYRNFNNAIGFSFLRFTTNMARNDQIKILSINSIFPSAETIQNGTYPFSDYFFAIYNKANQNENIQPFIEWILSEQGQKLIERSGYVPIKK